MASSGGNIVAVELADVGDRSCAICCHRLNDPRLLSCLHVFCYECIQQLTVSDAAESLCCPLCRTKCKLPAGGAAALPIDVTHSEGEASHTSIRCRTCSESRPDEEGGHKTPVVYCKQCGAAFCKEHGIAHVLSFGHGIDPFKGSQTVAGPASSCTSPPSCRQHDEPLTLFCQQCDVRVCGHCIAHQGSHACHSPVVPVIEMLRKRTEAVETWANKLRSELLPRKEECLKTVGWMTEETSTHADRVRAKIERAGERAVRAINEYVQQKVEEVNNDETVRCKVLDDRQQELRRDVAGMQQAVMYSEHFLQRYGSMDSMSDVKWSVLLAVHTRLSALTCAGGDELQDLHDHAALEFVEVVEDALSSEVSRLVGISGRRRAAPSWHFMGESSRTSLPGKPVSFLLKADDGDEEHLPWTAEDLQLSARWLKFPPQLSQEPAVCMESKPLRSECWVCFTPAISGDYAFQLVNPTNRLPLSFTLATSVSSELLSFDVTLCQTDIEVSDDKQTAKHTAEERYTFALGSSTMRRGFHSWTVGVQNPTGLTEDHLVGVVASDSVEENADDVRGLRETSFWWNNDGQCKTPSSKFPSPSQLTKFCNGDQLELSLDCEAHQLKIKNLRSGASDVMKGLPDADLRPYFCLFYPGSSFQFLQK